MDIIFADGGTYDDLGDYIKGSFIYEGEIYVNPLASEKEIIQGFKILSNKHPNSRVKLKALNSCILIMMTNIKKKYCL